MSEQEKAIEQARREAAEAARAEVLNETSAKLFRSELRAATTNLTEKAREDLLAKPEYAVTLLGLDEIPVTETGDIDSEAISQAVASYVEERPYLAASATPPAGSADQGTRTPPKSKGLEEQIADAEAAGDWELVGRLKLQKLAALPRP